jgi:hypothetical protein
MTTRQLDKSEWQAYFDRMAKTLNGKQAEIEVDSLELGQQIEAKWVPLLGIAYDPKSDHVEIIVEGLDHRISRPQSIFVEQDGMQLQSMEVIDSEDTRQIIKLREPLRLEQR